MTTNEAAERLSPDEQIVALAHFVSHDAATADVQTIVADEGRRILAAERRATVERIRARYNAVTMVAARDPDLLAILDEEAAR